MADDGKTPRPDAISDERRESFRQDVVRTFERYAPFYNLVELVLPFLGRNPRVLVAEAVDPEARLILDACTGNGAVLAAIARRRPAASVFGLDLSPDMLRLATRRVQRKGLTNAQLHMGDCTKMPFEDASFDVVTGSYGLHEMPADIRRAAVSESLRVLRPHGRLVVIDWDEPHRLIERPVAAARRAAEPVWMDELFGHGLPDLVRAAGFEDVRSRRDIFLSQLVTGTRPG